MRSTLLVLASGLLLAAPTSGQSTDLPPPEELPSEPVDSAGSVTPFGAFLRAVALPSWGHATIGSHRRGAFYLAAEGGTAWMIIKTISRRSAARDVLEAREAVATMELLVAGTPVEELEEAVASDPRVQAAQGWVDARQEQFEDWVAMGIFLTFLSGADAFVSAHLQDFPDPIDVQVSPTPDGGVQVAARLRVGW